MILTQAHKKQARSTNHRDALASKCNNANDFILYAADTILGLGYDMQTKKRNSPASSMTSTVPIRKLVWLCYGWADRPDKRQASTLMHELVHVRQQLGIGQLRFSERYALPHFRWIYEMQAYAESITVARSLGGDVSEMPANIAKTLWKKYKPWFPISEKELTSATVEVLTV